MLSNLPLLRPLIFFDTETTGVDTVKDRIIEMSTTKFFPNGTQEVKTHRFNPGIPIPPEASAVHGIRDIDVADEPTFASYADDISRYFQGCDIGGFNSTRFDIPLLVEEFLRAKVELPFNEDTKFIDALSIYHKYERRDLTAAYKFYCGKDHTNAHGAEADTLASAEVFNAQIEKYGLEPSMASLDALCNEGNITVDYSRKFVRNEYGDIVFTFGQYKGERVLDHIGFLQWMLPRDFPLHTKHCINKILSGEMR
jgi:DNA polymerase III subunit epsilon